jgi:hypothetical protein
MEQDILFHEKPAIPHNKNIIRSFLPEGDYRSIYLNNKKIHGRVWEGSQLIHSSIIYKACELGINFSFTKDTFLNKSRPQYEEAFGGKIWQTMYSHPDTMDEFSLYCALIEKTQIDYNVKAIHIRGPESIHRKFPEIYYGATKEQLLEVQNKIKYIDVEQVISFYYLVGLWNEINVVLSDDILKDYRTLLKHGEKWLGANELTRLKEILK